MKRKVALYLLIPIIIYMSYGLLIYQYELGVLPSRLKIENSEFYFDYKGVINVQSKKGGGAGTLKNVISEALDAQLDFLVFTDFNNFNPEREIEGYHGPLLTFIGGEFSYFDSRLLNIGSTGNSHLLGAGRSQIVFSDLLSSQNERRDTGFFVLAHPLKKGFTWKGTVPKGLSGVEVINLKEIWKNAWQNRTISFLWTLLIYPFNPELSLIRLFEEPSEVLSFWDQINTSQQVFGFAGSDANGLSPTPFGSINFPSYKVLFNIMTNHVLLESELTGEVKKDMNKIISALRKGQFYWSLDIMANPKGFYTSVIDKKTDQLYPMGSKIKFKTSLKIVIQLPEKPNVPFETILYKDGQPFVNSNSSFSELNIHSPGVYRVVVRAIPTFPIPDGKKWIPWIYSNPFYITK